MAKTWYPVVDYLNCSECGNCIAMCPHGVYDTAKIPSPVVTNPETVLRTDSSGTVHRPSGTAALIVRNLHLKIIYRSQSPISCGKT